MSARRKGMACSQTGTFLPVGMFYNRHVPWSKKRNKSKQKESPRKGAGTRKGWGVFEVWEIVRKNPRNDRIQWWMGIVTLHRYILIYLSGMKTLLLMDLEKVERIAAQSKSSLWLIEFEEGWGLSTDRVVVSGAGCRSDLEHAPTPSTT
jgi:hypothetical protein